MWVFDLNFSLDSSLSRIVDEPNAVFLRPTSFFPPCTVWRNCTRVRCTYKPHMIACKENFLCSSRRGSRSPRPYQRPRMEDEKSDAMICERKCSMLGTSWGDLTAAWREIYGYFMSHVERKFLIAPPPRGWGER